jgi:hypothetical protein
MKVANGESVIWKTTIYGSEEEVELPEGAMAISALANEPSYNTDIWWIVPDAAAPMRRFKVLQVMTGVAFQSEKAKFVATIRRGWMVLHVFVEDK